MHSRARRVNTSNSTPPVARPLWNLPAPMYRAKSRVDRRGVGSTSETLLFKWEVHPQRFQMRGGAQR